MWFYIAFTQLVEMVLFGRQASRIYVISMNIDILYLSDPLISPNSVHNCIAEWVLFKHLYTVESSLYGGGGGSSWLLCVTSSNVRLYNHFLNIYLRRRYQRNYALTNQENVCYPRTLTPTNRIDSTVSSSFFF